MKAFTNPPRRRTRPREVSGSAWKIPCAPVAGAYDITVRAAVHSLLVAAILVGLTLPRGAARTHEVPCSALDSCHTVPADCVELDPCGHGPQDESPCLPFDCGESDCSPQDHPCPSGPTPHDDGQHPGGPQSDESHHHHHHHCVCIAANSWLISESDRFALHPPPQEPLSLARENAFLPEAPVELLDRPPMR